MTHRTRHIEHPSPPRGEGPGVRGGPAFRSVRPLLALFSLLVAFSSLAVAQEPAPERKKKFEITVPYDGVEVFARYLDQAGLAPVKTLDELTAGPVEESILIVFGDPAPLVKLEATPGRVAGFLKQGGAILFASDRDFSFKSVPSLDLGKTFLREEALINMMGVTYRGERHCPIIYSTSSPDPNHDILKTLSDKIVTNCPGFIKVDRGLEPLLYLPPFTIPDPAVIRRFGQDEEDRGKRFAYLAVDPNRRLAVFAGHGVFMNCLAIREDIDNRRLALNVIDWLKEGKRTRVCLLAEGEPVTNFKLPLAGPPRPPMPSIDAINKILDVIQNEQLVQKLIDETIGPEPIVRTMLYIATLGLLFYGAKKFFQSRWTLESAPSALEGGAKVKPPLIVQRQRELARKNELGEPAQALARDWFQSYAGLDVRPGQPLPKMTYQIHAGTLQRFKLAKHVDSLWALAGDPHPRGWTSKRLHSLTAILEELSLAVIAGELEFEMDVVKPRS